MGREMSVDQDEVERMAAIAELAQAIPPHDVLVQWAIENRPPQSWYDNEEDDLLAVG